MAKFPLESEIIFTRKELDNFAKFSGDYNPIHCDTDYAQLNDYPDRVVYGALVVARILECIGTENVAEIRAEFINPVILSEKITLRIFKERAERLQIELFNQTHLKVRMKVFLIANNHIVLKSNFQALDFEESTLRSSQIPILLGEISRLIGMEQPGELALIRAINLRRKNMGSSSAENRRVIRSRNRFEVFATSIDSGDFTVEGISVQRNFKSVSEIVEEIQEIFPSMVVTSQPRKIWVFGITGTLGLRVGILFALKGHEIYGVYRSAEARARELDSTFKSLRLNLKLIRSDVFENMKHFKKSQNGDVICYCSSPRITTNYDAFDEELWLTYKKTYVDDLEKVIELFPEADRYFIPSTVYLNDNSPFKNINAEYCKAKAAQENLITQRFENSRFFMPRVGMFPGRHSHITIDSENEVLPTLLRELNEWLSTSYTSG